MTPEELKALEAERDDLKKKLEDANEDAAINAIAEKNAAKAIEKTHETLDTWETKIAQRTKEIVDAAMGEGLASSLAAFSVTPKLDFPNARRLGNLSLTNKQMLNVVMGRKALSVAGTNAGAEWVPTELGSELINMVELQNQLRSFIRTVDMPADVYELPTLTARGTVYYKGENSAPTASNPTTNKLTLSAKKMIGYYELSYELEENSIIPVIPMLKEDMAKQIANAEERAIIWGDDTTTAASNIDKNVASGNPQLAFNGLWYTAKNGTATWWTAYGTSWTASLNALQAAMGTYAIMPSELIIIAPVYVINKLKADTNFVTWDKVGPNASVLTGMLPNAQATGAIYGFFYGIPVIASPYVYNTDANGVRLTTAGDNTKYGALLVNRNRVILGQRKGIAAEMDTDITAQTRKLVLSERVALGLPDGGTTGAYGAVYNGS